MIRLNDLSLQATAGLSVSCFVAMAHKYNPLINYDWSTTTTSGLRYLKDVGSTPTYNASMYFGRGAYLNGVDQTITVPINTTIQTALKRVNGVVTINETSQTLTNYVISGLGVHKDYYLFTRLLTTAEKDSYTNTPELFYAMAQADSTCVLNMPMCETSSTVRNYKTGIDYPITNYTSSVRDNAKNLQYGLQTCKFVRDSLGVIQSASDYLECDGVGYANTGLVLLENADYTISFVINLKAGVDGAVVSDFGMLGSHKIRRHTNGYMYFIGVLERVVWQVDGDYQAYFVVKFKADGSVEVKKNNSLLFSTSYATTYNASNFIIKECSSKLDTTVFRKFIIDDKLTTDEEDTIAFNDAVNKGLLS